jgi:hypothetical protein
MEIFNGNMNIIQIIVAIINLINENGWYKQA